MRQFESKVICLFFLLLLSGRCLAYEVVIPDFVRFTPKGHFAGISTPCDNLHAAKKSSVDDVARQIAGSIDTLCRYEYESRVSVSPKRPAMYIRDDFYRAGKGVVLDVEKNIVKSVCRKDNKSKFICFILVRYPDVKILDMVRLSKGANLVAAGVSKLGNELKIKITETNGVAVKLSCANVQIIRINRLAKLYNFCIWKVPYGSNQEFIVPLEPVPVCGNSLTMPLKLHSDTKWADFFLGAKLTYHIQVNGFDELGKTVNATLTF